MPLVFVHGVNNREGDPYREGQALRDSLFRKFALPSLVRNSSAAFLASPYWGKYAAQFSWDLASLPGGDVEALGAEDEIPIGLLGDVPAGTPKEQVVLDVARRTSLEAAIDLLYATRSPEAEPEEADKLASLAVQAESYARANPHPPWLKTVENDDQLLSELAAEVESWKAEPSLPGVTREGASEEYEALGLDEMWDHLREAKTRIQSAFGRLLAKPVLHLARPPLTRAVGTFLGDIFVYLRDRGSPDNPGPIVFEVVEALRDARNKITDDDKRLVVIGHSMGGNIVYDILTYFEPDFVVDAFVTVGSQVALFEELKLFEVSDRTIRMPQKVERPRGAHTWINIYDVNDILGFAAGRVFSGVRDFEYSTGSAIRTHGQYFSLPSFHSRLGERLREAGL